MMRPALRVGGDRGREPSDDKTQLPSRCSVSLSKATLTKEKTALHYQLLAMFALHFLRISLCTGPELSLDQGLSSRCMAEIS